MQNQSLIVIYLCLTIQDDLLSKNLQTGWFNYLILPNGLALYILSGEFGLG